MSQPQVYEITIKGQIYASSAEKAQETLDGLVDVWFRGMSLPWIGDAYVGEVGDRVREATLKEWNEEEDGPFDDYADGYA